ncbi:MAG TPA: exosortase/archaeosortase family protein [Candidatus Acidoferrales bacterium]|nr:exosortase/archaeosortase family protein [Candidatus Acidoferrales bacterium]
MLETITCRHIAYAALIAASALVCHKRLAALMMYAWTHDSSSQILLIPFVTLYLIWLARKRIFAVTSLSIVPGITAILSGGIVFWIASAESLHLQGNEALCLSALSFVLIWMGGFLLCYGSAALRAGAFPLLFLLLMIPFPDPVLNWIIHQLQQGSTDITYLIFRTLGVPAHCEGFLISVPGVTIEVAKECSSIRSSMALLITCLLAAHLYLRTWWKAFVFVLLSLPLSIIKNGIRIATLTLLSVYVNPDFLRGDLHRDGGFVFFFLALLMLWPVFIYLEKSDRPSTISPSAIRTPSEVLERG